MARVETRVWSDLVRVEPRVWSGLIRVEPKDELGLNPRCLEPKSGVMACLGAKVLEG